MRKKVLSIVGARPQFIKLGPLSNIIRNKFNEIIVHTGQHYHDNMSKQFFINLGIPDPDYNLGIGSGSHAWQTGQMMVHIEEVLKKEKPDVVIVFGDTNSTVAGALTAVKLQIPVAHVEAGLRSFNRSMPEELNRIVTDRCSDLLLAPTKTAVQNLRYEGFTDNVYLSGDIMLDALTLHITKAKDTSKILETLKLKEKDYLLLTLHRPYNVDNFNVLKNFFETLAKVEEKIIFPIHPRTKKMITNFNMTLSENILIINPVGYFDFLNLENNAKKVITDSGGIQKEAYLLKIPCITVRPETEWIETVNDGWNVVVGFDNEKVLEAINNFFPSTKQGNIFGEYSCAEKMVNIIEQRFL